MLEVLVELLLAGPWRLLDLGAGTGSLRGRCSTASPRRASSRSTWTRSDARSAGRARRRPVGGSPGARPTCGTGLARCVRSGPARSRSTPSSRSPRSTTSTPRELAAIYPALGRRCPGPGLILNAEGLAAGSPGSQLARAFDRGPPARLAAGRWLAGRRLGPTRPSPRPLPSARACETGCGAPAGTARPRRTAGLARAGFAKRPWPGATWTRRWWSACADAALSCGAAQRWPPPRPHVKSWCHEVRMRRDGRVPACRGPARAPSGAAAPQGSPGHARRHATGSAAAGTFRRVKKLTEGR